LWQAIGTDGFEEAFAIAVQGNRVFTAGRANVAISTAQGEFIVNAYDAKTGKLLWKNRIDSTANGSGEARDMVASQGGVYAVGLSHTPDSGNDFAVRAYDAKTGVLLWEDIVDGSEGAFDQALAVAIRGNQVFAAGRLDNVGTGGDFVVRAYRANTGTLLWQDVVDGTASGDDAAIDITAGTNAIFAVGELGNAGSQADFTIRAYMLRNDK
jgi:outer membrane protein assembly factor BamB